MSNPAVITKIEQVTEAIESFIVAIVARETHQANLRAGYDNITEARKEVTDALTAFLAPTLRVVTTEPAESLQDGGPMHARFLSPREHIPAPDARPAYPTA